MFREISGCCFSWMGNWVFVARLDRFLTRRWFNFCPVWTAKTFHTSTHINSKNYIKKNIWYGLLTRLLQDQEKTSIWPLKLTYRREKYKLFFIINSNACGVRYCLRWRLVSVKTIWFWFAIFSDEYLSIKIKWILSNLWIIWNLPLRKKFFQREAVFFKHFDLLSLLGVKMK